MAENQSAHRQDLEKKVINSDIINSRLGIVFALIISLAFFGLAAYLVKNNHEYIGALLGVIDVGSLTATFIYGSKTRRTERQSRQNQQKPPVQQS